MKQEYSFSVLSACGSDEKSFEGELGGYFTIALINMLKD